MIGHWWRFAIAFSILAPALFVGGMELKRAKVASDIEEAWRTDRVTKVTNLGSTESLEILPLINWYARSGEFATEPGVSYLVRTDSHTILFDAGFNPNGLRPSPLESNMAKLGISASEIDAVFISHLHRDHVGGVDNESSGRVSFGAGEPELKRRLLFAPVPLSHSSMQPAVLRRAARIGEGIGTTGPIARALFMGKIEEQALVINVEGRGLIVLVGCGHQALPKLLKRIDDAFDEPLYGIVGDLHYPVPKGRLSFWGIDAQRRLASGDGIFRPISAAEIESDMNSLASRKLGLLALGAHDTSDEVIGLFAKRLQSRFRRIEVGVPVRMSPTVGFVGVTRERHNSLAQAKTVR